MTPQETFDFVATALIKQGCRSMGPDGCAYRGANGTKCAAGHLIPDEDYDPAMDDPLQIPDGDHNGTSVYSRRMSKYFTARGFGLPLLCRLQQAHDFSNDLDFVGSLSQRLRVVARDFGLSDAVLDAPQEAA